MLKFLFKKYALKYLRSIDLREGATINFNVVNNGKGSDFDCRIINSQVSFTTMNEGVIVSDCKTYGDVRIERFATITGPGTVVKALSEHIIIGAFSSIGQNVCIVDFNHNFNRPTSSFINHLVLKKHFTADIVTKGPVIIEEDVFIGSNSTILPGVTIGRGAIIGAGCVVSADVPPYAVVVGNPAKVKKMRFNDEIIQLLEMLKWWDWDTKKILRNEAFFNADLNELSIDKIRSLVHQ